MKEKRPTYILAEMASSHEGRLETGEFIIKAAAAAKADGILFQIMNLDTYIVPDDVDYEDTVSFFMGHPNWAKLIDTANALGLDVWANVYDMESARFCAGKNIKGYKFHSSNLENEDMVREIVRHKKEMLISVGGMKPAEVERVLELIYATDKDARLDLMYGLQNFPTNPEGVNLNYILELAEKYGLPFGYQDHSEPESPASTYLPIMFVARGAAIIEKHLTYDRSLKGQDYEAALNPDEFAGFVRDIRIVDGILAKQPDEVSEDELKYREYKTLIKVVAIKDIEPGDVFSEDNIRLMRAKKGEIAGKKIKALLGRKATSAYRRYDTIKADELPKVGLFITARLKSKRLPMKVIKPIMGRPMIEWMIERLKRCNISPLVLMTSTNPQDDPLIGIAEKCGVPSFRGSEDDVLERIRDCNRQFKVDLIISVTADDPLKEPLYIEKMVERYYDTRYDFCEHDGLPNGCEAYAVSAAAIEAVCEAKDAVDTEIWGPFFKDSGLFKCEVIEVTDPAIRHPEYRITVDTPEDFEVVSKVFETFVPVKPEFNVYDICKFLDEHPELVALNSHIVQRKAPPIRMKKK